MNIESRSPKNWSSAVKYGTGCAVFATLLVAASATLATARDDSGPADRAPVTVTRTTSYTGPCFMARPDWNVAVDGPNTCTR